MNGVSLWARIRLNCIINSQSEAPIGDRLCVQLLSLYLSLCVWVSERKRENYLMNNLWSDNNKIRSILNVSINQCIKFDVKIFVLPIMAPILQFAAPKVMNTTIGVNRINASHRTGFAQTDQYLCSESDQWIERAIEEKRETERWEPMNSLIVFLSSAIKLARVEILYRFSRRFFGLSHLTGFINYAKWNILCKLKNYLFKKFPSIYLFIISIVIN